MESPSQAYDPFGLTQQTLDGSLQDNDDSNDNRNNDNDTKMCSVLNIVVDHSMEDPTPMEPEEWKKLHHNDDDDTTTSNQQQDQQRLQLKVPVLRIFGPLVRHPQLPPLQTACLYIHGAFPYMLARPVVAGPDGSLLRASPSSSTNNINWDDPEDVARIQVDIKVILENTLRSLDFSYGDKKGDENNSSSNSQHKRPNRQHPYIRNVTIVEGRGFYSFSPGPTAPFLRVEYYDPKMRWKVKLVLEKGLEVPHRYHPDPRQYDRDVADAVEENDVLKFHCYEAHIPYTMQFFKDHNLAGMSYIHLRKGRIRRKLPTKFFVKTKQHSIPNTRGSSEEERQELIERSVFLQSNTPDEWLWPKSKATTSKLPADSDQPLSIHQPSQASVGSETLSPVGKEQANNSHSNIDQGFLEIVSHSKYAAPSAGTSCDVEIDCTTDDIQNVDAVLKTMPSDQEERDRIQWRAAPSLQEIWREERARMNKLLSPALTQEVMQDVLSQNPSPSKAPGPAFTLNVKENASQSGARLAVKGMWSLVNLTEGLQEDFLRALYEILERHRKAIEDVDRQLREERQMSRLNANAHKSTSPATKGMTPRQFRFTPPTSSGKETIASGSQSTPSMEEAVDALETLGRSLPASQTNNAAEELSSTPTINEAIDMLDSMVEASPSLNNGVQSPSVQESPQEVDRMTSNVQSPQANNDNDSIESTTLSQPLSLRSAQGLLSTTELEASQRIDRGESVFESDSYLEFIDPETLAPYDQIELDEDRCRAIFVIENGSQTVERVCGFRAHFCSREGHGDAVRRAKPGWYKTISTGAVVDGLVGESVLSTGDETELEEDFESLERFCQMSQNDYEAISESLGGETKPRHRVRFNDVLATQEKEGRMDGNMPEDDLSSDEESTNNDDSTTSKRGEASPPSSQPLDDGRALTRKEVSNSGNLLRRSSEHTLPEWLSQASSYTKVRAERQKTRSRTRRPRLRLDVDSLQPVARAPTRKTVRTWGRKRSRRDTKKTADEQPKSAKKIKSAHLEIDSNTRKIVASSCARGDNFNPDIEEVGWELTQPSQLTPSQQSQDLFDDEEKKSHSESQDDSVDALEGIGAQGGRIHVQGGGGLKAKTSHTQPEGNHFDAENKDVNGQDTNTSYATPVSVMSVEVHVQCREGLSRLDAKKISLSWDSNKDSIVAITFVYARDPGGGNSIEILQRGCICTSLEGENPQKEDETNLSIQTQLLRSMPRSAMGIFSPLSVEVVKNERHILRRFKDIVRMKDPDMMLSWDTQGVGLGYIIERGLALGNPNHGTSDTPKVKNGSLDMVKLLGRTPTEKKPKESSASFGGEAKNGTDLGQQGGEKKFQGSGLGSDWDDRVGAGAAAASIVGRLVFAGWKIVAEEVKHGNASYLPAVVAAVLNRRIPHHDDMTLAKWYASGTERWRVLSYRLTQATSTLLLFDALDIVGRAGEAARLSGVEFSQSFPGIRGSQYKVEGVLLRALQSLRSDERGSMKGKRARAGGLTANSQFSSASDESKSQTQSPWKVRRRHMESDGETTRSIDDRQYFFFSPSLEDTNKQEALEVQALTLEPMSGHYTDPVVVCDFTALYPSLVIAYNLCYSTCIGKLEYHSTRKEMRIKGRTTGRIGPVNYPERRTATILKHHFKSIAENTASAKEPSAEVDISKDRGYVSPSGTLYVSEGVLKGVLPQVLDEILTTRAMLKRAAKEYKKAVKDLSPAILRQLEARQLALKYVANVTYGYTSATFSGRSAMPLLADSIVECGRRTLRKAINIANRWGEGTDAWGRTDDRFRGCQVIYGDTDSLFIRMPGLSYKEAFEFGELLCKAVTSLNPPPVQLKLEKVYVGSIMQTMKRYCGMKYESKDQKKPTFEAKGLETVRRDQCALTQKVLRNALITLFKHGIEAVREYLHRQWSSIFAGNLPVSDFILTGRVRSKYRGGKEGPVQAVLSRRLGESDPGRIVRHKARIPYVIVATPGMTFRLKDCVLTPLELLERWDAYKLHPGYYIERHVNAALQRCLGLAPHFVKVSDWYQACPKPRRRTHFWPIKSRSAMITAYFGNDICSLCDRKCQADGSSQVVVCAECRKDPVKSLQAAAAMVNDVEVAAKRVANECSKCNGCFESADTFALVQKTSQEAVGRAQNPNNRFFGAPKRSKPKDSILLPLANCVCIDCPNTFSRHRLREQGIEAQSTLDALTRES